MRIPYEKDLRERLANQLDLIEPGLRLVETEYPIPNAKGTRGRVDILARDGHNSWVVIELKRADGAARQALHEVTKYTELLRREKGLRQDRIRAIIVSTTWHELLVPVSNLARDWSHDLRGYHLILGRNGELVRAKRVELLAASSIPEVTPIHFIFFFNTEEDRDRGWQQVVNRAADVGTHDLLAANIQRIHDLELVQAPFGLYVALGRMNPTQVPPQIKAAAAGCDEAPGYELEYEALCHITRHVFGVSFESAAPNVLRHIHEDRRWVIEGYRTAGAFGKRSPFSARDLLRDLNGDDGGIGQIRYTGSARTTDRGRWPVFLTEYTRALSHNKDWTLLVNHWLEDVAAAPTESDVILHVYNPCDLIGTLVHGWPNNLQPLEPMLYGVARTQTGRYRIIHGGLYWDGNLVPNLTVWTTLVYPEPINWSIACVYGENRQRDALLTETLGLRYVLVERLSQDLHPPSKDDAVTLWLVSDSQVSRITSPFEELREMGWRGAYPLRSFFQEHHRQINTLVTTYRQALSIQPLRQATAEDEPDLADVSDDEPIAVQHTVPDGKEPTPRETDLQDCTVPTQERFPDETVAKSLTAIARLSNPSFERKLAIQICAINGGPAATAAEWLLETLSELHTDAEVVPQDGGVPNTSTATRSDYIVGTCYLIGLRPLPMELRRRAADRLVAFCHDSGYAEARRLLHEKSWAWLPSVLQTSTWGRYLAPYVAEDNSVSGETRESVTAAIDALIESRNARRSHNSMRQRSLRHKAKEH